MNTYTTKYLPEADIKIAKNHYWGYCRECGDFSGLAEPDVDGATCPECFAETLMGVEEALMTGALAPEETRKPERPCLVFLCDRDE